MALTKVTSGVIAANAVVDSFGTQSLTGDKYGLQSISANAIVDGTITGDKYGLQSISANAIVNGTITAAKITDSTITTGQFASSANSAIIGKSVAMAIVFGG